MRFLITSLLLICSAIFSDNYEVQVELETKEIPVKKSAKGKNDIGSGKNIFIKSLSIMYSDNNVEKESLPHSKKFFQNDLKGNFIFVYKNNAFVDSRIFENKKLNIENKLVNEEYLCEKEIIRAGPLEKKEDENVEDSADTDVSHKTCDETKKYTIVGKDNVDEFDSNPTIVVIIYYEEKKFGVCNFDLDVLLDYILIKSNTYAMNVIREEVKKYIDKNKDKDNDKFFLKTFGYEGSIVTYLFEQIEEYEEDEEFKKENFKGTLSFYAENHPKLFYNIFGPILVAQCNRWTKPLSKTSRII